MPPTTARCPIGLVVPRDAEDVAAAVDACRRFGVPVLPRGAGTSLAGQCCNVAVVLDFTKYMNRILEIDPDRRFARVEPGVVLDTLRSRAETHKLTFGPDPSTHSRCTLGGMIGNNSCGTHSLLAGKTVDNVEELRVLLYDGTELTVGATGDAGSRRDGQAGRTPRPTSTRISAPFGSGTPTPSARSFRIFPDGSPATTWTTCSPSAGFTSRARWSAAKAPAPSSSTRRSR